MKPRLLPNIPDVSDYTSIYIVWEDNLPIVYIDIVDAFNKWKSGLYTEHIYLFKRKGEHIWEVLSQPMYHADWIE